jgi:hypothetical protein
MIDIFEAWLDKLKKRLREANSTLIDMGVALGMGIVFAFLVSVPFTFVRDLNLGAIRFFPGIIVMCIVLYRRGFQRGYLANSHSYSFSLRTSAVNMATAIVLQSLIILIWRNHVLCITGPTFWIVKTLFPAARSMEARGYILHEIYNWLMMLLADCLLYGPVLIYGEYVGSKEHLKDFNNENQE